MPVAVITGASSGIGFETAKALAAKGWRVIGVGRDPDRSAAAEDAIRAVSTTGEVEMLRADLASMADTKRLADNIAARTDRIDVLVNNAGKMANAFVVTPEGNEENFAGNHLGPFLLTKELLPLLKAAAKDAPKGSVRIVNTSSDASEMIPGLKWDDLQLLGGFNAGYAYCQSKLANVLHAKGLAKRLADDGIVVHALHPGVVSSNFISHADAQSQESIKKLAAQSRTPEAAADGLIWLASGEEPGETTGGYYHQREKKPPNPLAEDDEAVERLWTESERMVAGR
jgi:NAD(P)-dependent dehydrogenase (short-subunit alcohol dehydrogenase family)